MVTIAAVVATHNRPQLLANRALASIALQTRPPDYLVVVDDSDRKARRANQQIVADFRAAGTQVMYLENYRTPGASGAWNTALSELLDAAPSAFIAVLDDDDSWEPTYLQRCEEAVSDRNLDMAAAGIAYHGSRHGEAELLNAPVRLDVGELLVRNPHIQGSNLFVRLRKLLEAGGFDEALVSTTDRDLCIRLADLGSVRYGPISEHLVHHYAESGRSRLSTPGGDAKRAGLTHFYRKFRSRMSDEQRSAFLTRSRNLFNCDPATPVVVPSPAEPVPIDPGGSEHLNLVVGAITSPEVGSIANLVNSLVLKINCRSDVTLKVVLLENGGHDPASRHELRELAGNALSNGLDLDVKTLEQQALDADAGVFAAAREELSRRKSIALSRTMLQHYLFLEAKPRQGAVVWILDDDVILEGLGYGADGSIRTEDVDYVAAIRRLKKTGSCVVLGQVTGEPPLPVLSCVRTQLVDLHHNLIRLRSFQPDTLYPSRENENRLIRMNSRDYYYDLSRAETDRLESPFWYEPSGGNMTAGQAFNEMVSCLPGILGGRQVFRPLVRAGWSDPPSELVPSANRGPSTLVFDLQTLRKFPNAVPTFDGADTRRSDMVWCLLNRFVGGYTVVQAPLPIRQNRMPAAMTEPDFETLAQDIRGYALYSSLHDVFLSKARDRQKLGRKPYSDRLLYFEASDIRSAVRLYGKYVRERCRAFELSFVRIMGILSGLRSFYENDLAGGPPPWWVDSSEYRTSVKTLRNFVESLEAIYTQRRLNDFRKNLSEIDRDVIEQYLKDLPSVVDQHSANTRQPVKALEEAAKAYVQAEFGTGPLVCLGIGGEGVVLTDGRLAYKYFHYWRHRDKERRIQFLQSLAGRLSGYKTLLDIMEVRRRGDHVVAVYPHYAGTSYKGGRLAEMLTMLRELREAGIACRNIHPSNLLVTPSGLKLIDYGADIVPATDENFEQMCRRAVLSYQFHFRPDLKRLMTKALTDAALPELTGLQQFKNALDLRSAEDLLHLPMVDLVLAGKPKSVLDYGCGDGWLAERISLLRVGVTGYDSDAARIARLRERGGSVTYGGGELLHELKKRSAKFDVVVCSRVLCTIEDPAEFNRVLRDLRVLLAESGTAMVAVCNPFYLSVASTELAEKRLPAAYEYEDTFAYTKMAAHTGNLRTEVHRSFAAYKRAFTVAGLHIREVLELDGTDTRALRPASEHLVFRLSPEPETRPRVSLLIKSCLMEWRTIERNVRHQVGQLEGPTKFHEKIVVVDPSAGPFARQHDEPNAEAHRAAMDRLVADGVVDLVIYAPEDPEIIRGTYRKWFAAESDETHSTNGQQLFATLYGFDACTGDYILQLDSDLLIARTDRNHAYLDELIDVFRGDPKALFVPMSAWRTDALPYTSEGSRGDWRVEVRGCLFDRERLQSVLPVANELAEGRFAMAWHRAFDRFIASGDYRSYRGGDPRTAFIHVPNDRKTDVEGLFDITGAVERGYVPDVQLGRVDLTGSVEDWAGHKRREPFVFVVCGHNVDPGRFKRCFDSLLAQESRDWGAVVVDDASTNGFGDYAAMLLADYADKVTLVRNRTRRGTLYNTWNAVTRFCANPESVIITLDADDALIGANVLERVRTEYEAGADVTIGSMLRLDKEAHYPVDFDVPRSRSSNVWQHLRTFKKYLFDAIAVEDLKLDGQWIELANDWAFMVPIVEMTSCPRYIPDRVYLYEPGAPKSDGLRRRRDGVIARILAKPAYARFHVNRGG